MPLPPSEMLRPCPACRAVTTLALCRNCIILQSLGFQYSRVEEFERACQKAVEERKRHLRLPPLEGERKRKVL